jgi:hypothetical protein
MNARVRNVGKPPTRVVAPAASRHSKIVQQAESKMSACRPFEVKLGGSEAPAVAVKVTLEVRSARCK